MTMGVFTRVIILLFLSLFFVQQRDSSGFNVMAVRLIPQRRQTVTHKAPPAPAVAAGGFLTEDYSGPRRRRPVNNDIKH